MRQVNAMSFGRMSEIVTIIREQHSKDAEGFDISTDIVLAQVRAYHEQRHGNIKWANRAAFSEATHLFRFRVIPGVAVEPLLIIESAAGRFQVLSVEVLGKMYVELLCQEVEPRGS
jgi:hypothetical protein